MPALVIEPYEQAVARLAGKTPVASALRSAQWQAMPQALRERAFFAAGVENLRTVSEMRTRIGESLALSRDPSQPQVDRSRFVAEMRELLGAPEGDSGRLTDLASRRRLELVYDFQREDAIEYARWQAEQDPDILDAFPAQELVRVESRDVPRDWAERWQAAGGPPSETGRLVALKSDPVWSRISRFGRPWPPFDYNSGMGLEDVERSEAERLGLIRPTERPQPQAASFNAQLEASLPAADAALLEAFREVFGDQVDVKDGRIVWRRSVGSL